MALVAFDIGASTKTTVISPNKNIISSNTITVTPQEITTLNGVIGAFGNVVFSVSSDKILTFSEFQKSGSARWEEQEVIGRKPKQEFKGPGLEMINFQMELKAQFGFNPLQEVEKLVLMRDKGQYARLIIGGKSVGKNKWFIDNLTEAWKEIDNKGNVLSVALTISLKEYAG